MNPLNLIKLDKIMALSQGNHDIKIGIIDGPLDFSHPAFENTIIRTVKDSQFTSCKNASSMECIHGTFISGILGAKRGSSAPAICPECEILLRPVFMESISDNEDHSIDKSLPNSTHEELSKAIVETIDAGAKIINLSLGLSSSTLTIYPDLEYAYNYAFKKQVIIVASSGNQGIVGNNPITDNEWIIPVAACDEKSRPEIHSNFGLSTGLRGLLSPGVNITSTMPEGRFGSMSGTSVASPFVTGSLALLWSIFPDVTANQIRNSVILNNNKHRRTIIPQLLDAESAFNWLKNSY